MLFNCVFIILCSFASIVLSGVTKDHVSNKIMKPIRKVGCAAMPELPKNHPGSRVVNGSSTGKPFPYQLQLKNNDRPWCGAVLISPRFALSAHHCITEVPNNPKKSLSLVAGAYTSWDSDEIGQVRNIKDINQLYHQDGSATQKPQDPDIVIIEVHEAFVMNTYVRPACLPTRKALPGETCIVSGWGITENMHPQEEDFDLQAAKLDVVPSDDVSFCKKMWKYYSEKYGKSEYVGEHSLCAFDSHSSACKGDSGGPLVCGTSGGAMIHGIVSFGNPHCRTRAEDNVFDEFDPYPGVFVDVYHFVDQIKPFIEGDQPCPVDHHYFKDGVCDEFLNNPDNCFDGGDCCGLGVVCAGDKCECHSSTKRDEM